MRVFFYGNIYIGLLAGGLVWANSLLFNAVDINVIMFMFFSATLVYNADRILFYHHDEKNNPERTRYIRENYELIWFIILVCSFGILSIMENIELTILLPAFGLSLITILYFFIYNKAEKIITPWIAGLLKPGILGLVWSSGTVILPVFSHPVYLKLPVLYVIFFIRFSEYFINGFLFDYRDKAGDKENKARNIFNIWPENLVIFFLLLTAVLLIAAISVSIFKGFISTLFFSDVIILLFYVLILAGLLFKNVKILDKLTKNKMSYAIVIDSVLFLPVFFTFFIYIV